MNDLTKRFVSDEAGATAIEYGMIAALIAVAVITVIQTIGTKLNVAFKSISDML